jgi:hypothetical protein
MSEGDFSHTGLNMGMRKTFEFCLDLERKNYCNLVALNFILSASNFALATKYGERDLYYKKLQEKGKKGVLISSEKVNSEWKGFLDDDLILIKQNNDLSIEKIF